MREIALKSNNTRHINLNLIRDRQPSESGSSIIDIKRNNNFSLDSSNSIVEWERRDGAEWDFRSGSDWKHQSLGEFLFSREFVAFEIYFKDT